MKLSDEELQALTARAAVAGVSKQRLLVEAATADRSAAGGGYAMTRSERNALIAELGGAMRVVGAVSNNLHQLATVANSTGQAELAPAAAAVTAAMQRLHDTVDALT